MVRGEAGDVKILIFMVLDAFEEAREFDILIVYFFKPFWIVVGA